MPTSQTPVTSDTAAMLLAMALIVSPLSSSADSHSVHFDSDRFHEAIQAVFDGTVRGLLLADIEVLIAYYC